MNNLRKTPNEQIMTYNQVVHSYSSQKVSCRGSNESVNKSSHFCTSDASKCKQISSKKGIDVASKMPLISQSKIRITQTYDHCPQMTLSAVYRVDEKYATDPKSKIFLKAFRFL